MTGHFNLLDVLFLAIIILSTIFGIVKGFIRELFSLAFFVIALILSFLYYADVGNIYGNYVSKNVANFAGFITIFVLVLITGILVTFFIKKMFILGPLKFIDRIFGGIFGLVRGILIAALVVFLMIAFQINENLVKKSRFSPFVLETIRVVFKLTPDKFKEKKEEIIDDISRQKNS